MSEAVKARAIHLVAHHSRPFSLRASSRPSCEAHMAGTGGHTWHTWQAHMAHRRQVSVDEMHVQLLLGLHKLCRIAS
jgi:hypothetical protein